MTKTPMPVNFTDADHRDQWITDNADYFTIINRKNRKYSRIERPNLPEAEQTAREIIRGDKTLRLLIYAVYGDMTAYVKTIAVGK